MKTLDSILQSLLEILKQDVNLSIEIDNGNTLWLVYQIVALLIYEAYEEKEMAKNAWSPQTATDMELDGLGLLFNFKRPYIYPYVFPLIPQVNYANGLPEGTLINIDSSHWFVFTKATAIKINIPVFPDYAGDLENIPPFFKQGKYSDIVLPDGKKLTLTFQLENDFNNVLTKDDTYRKVLSSSYISSARGIRGSLTKALLAYQFVEDIHLLVGNQVITELHKGHQEYRIVHGEIIAIIQLSIVPPAVIAPQYPIFGYLGKVIMDKKDLFNTTPAPNTYVQQIDVSVPIANNHFPISFVLGFPQWVKIIDIKWSPSTFTVPDSIKIIIVENLVLLVNQKTLGESLFFSELNTLIFAPFGKDNKIKDIGIVRMAIDGVEGMEWPVLFDEYHRINKDNFELNFSGFTTE